LRETASFEPLRAKIRRRVWPVGEFLKKRYMDSYKNFCVYFTHLPGSPPWRDLHEILCEGSSRRRNQPCQILSQSGQGFWFCGEGSNFWLSHKKEKSLLTQGLNYRSACDTHKNIPLLIALSCFEYQYFSYLKQNSAISKFFVCVCWVLVCVVMPHKRF